jgi:hypothetical protein
VGATPSDFGGGVGTHSNLESGGGTSSDFGGVGNMSSDFGGGGIGTRLNLGAACSVRSDIGALMWAACHRILEVALVCVQILEPFTVRSVRSNFGGVGGVPSDFGCRIGTRSEF